MHFLSSPSVFAEAAGVYHTQVAASHPSLTIPARVKSFFLSFHSFFLFSMHTSPFTPASGLVQLPLTNCIDDHGSLVI
jgi:hypothetical protein